MKRKKKRQEALARENCARCRAAIFCKEGPTRTLKKRDEEDELSAQKKGHGWWWGEKLEIIKPTLPRQLD